MAANAGKGPSVVAEQACRPDEKSAAVKMHGFGFPGSRRRGIADKDLAQVESRGNRLNRNVTGL
jgi:hypothetical protein